MSHLTLETMARLVDETPTALEAAHLTECDTCRQEVETMRDEIRGLATLPDMAPAPDAWHAIEQRLTAEGLIRTTRTFPFPVRTLLQAAAAAVLFVGGLSAGRLLAPAVQVAHAPQNDALSEPVLASPATPAAVLSQGVDVTEAPLTQSPGSPNVTLASLNPTSRIAQARSLDEIGTILRQTEELHLAALTRYAELATNAQAGDPVARLAALQSIVMTTQAALSQTPTDPVINGYHLTALAQRDAALRQVAANTDRWY